MLRNLTNKLTNINPSISALEKSSSWANVGDSQFSRDVFGKFGTELIYEMDVIQELKKSGWIVLRRALDPQRCADYKRLIQTAFDTLEAEVRNIGINPAVYDPSWLESGHRTAFDLFHAQVHPENFSRIHPGKSIFDLLNYPQVRRLMDICFAGHKYWVQGGAHTRRVIPKHLPTAINVSQSSSGSQDFCFDEKNSSSGPDKKPLEFKNPKILQPPVPWHIDAEFYTPNNFCFNFWVTMDDCGVSAPGMRMVTAAPQDIQDFVRYDPQKGTFDKNRLDILHNDPLSIHKVRGASCPQLEVGDLLIFSNWTVHSTHDTSFMSSDRQSAELRYVYGRWTFPES